MLRQLIRSSQSIALGFSLCLVAGCGESSAPVDDSDVTNVKITGNDTDTLAANNLYKVDLSREGVVYHFDYNAKPIAYDRLQLVFPNAEAKLLSEEMQMVESGNYGDYPQPNLLGASDHQFSIASNEADFGVLNAEELATLRKNGFFYQEAALNAPTAKPQSTDNCIHATCEFCFENGTNSPPVTWEAGTYHCYIEEHVWCD